MRNPFRRLRNVKWWFMRANGKVPPCDWWDFDCALANYIAQGLKGLLYEGVRDWDCKEHQKEREELEFVLNWAATYPYMKSGIVALDDKDYVELVKKYGNQDSDVMIISPKGWEEFEKQTDKAMRLLAKNFMGLWD